MNHLSGIVLICLGLSSCSSQVSNMEVEISEPISMDSESNSCKKDKDCRDNQVCENKVCKVSQLNSTSIINVVEKTNHVKELELCDAEYDSRKPVKVWRPEAIDEEKGFWYPAPVNENNDIVFVDFKSKLKEDEYSCYAKKMNMETRSLNMSFPRDPEDLKAGGVYVSIDGNANSKDKQCIWNGFYSFSGITADDGWQQINLKGVLNRQIIDSGDYCLVPYVAPPIYN